MASAALTIEPLMAQEQWCLRELPDGTFQLLKHPMPGDDPARMVQHLGYQWVVHGVCYLCE
jgi:hypothetical protein